MRLAPGAAYGPYEILYPTYYLYWENLGDAYRWTPLSSSPRLSI
jgi:hypothetical protein